MTTRPYEELTAATRRRLVVRALVRPALSVTVLLLLYYVLPWGERLNGPTAVGLLIGLVAFAALLFWQIRGIKTAKYPRLRAIEALAVSLPLFVLAFAAVYYATEATFPASFSEGLSRTDALYFAVTVLATVGFGDITPVTQGARVVVMIQMIGDLVLIGVVARVIMRAVQSAVRSREPGAEPD